MAMWSDLLTTGHQRGRRNHSMMIDGVRAAAPV